MPATFFFFWLAVVVVVILFVRLQALGRALAALSERLTKLDQAKPEAPIPPPVPEKIPFPPSPLLERRTAAAPPTPPDMPPIPPRVPSPPLPVPAATPAAASEPTTPFNWKAFMGVKLFA